VYLLDTNIVSEVLRRRPDPKVIARLSQVEPEEIHASVITLLGTPIGVNDCLIGGTALVHNLVLVSRNVRHFEKVTDLLQEVW
jgi:predicted nucleic acid-binding protein